jgi:hypothetical protein
MNKNLTGSGISESGEFLGEGIYDFDGFYAEADDQAGEAEPDGFAARGMGTELANSRPSVKLIQNCRV